MLSAIIALFATVVAHAGVKVTDLAWKADGAKGRFVVTFKGPATANPDWDVKGGRFAMTLAGVDIEKNTVRFIEGVRIAAANTSRGVLTTLTFPNGAISADNIALTVGEGKIEITTAIPKNTATAKATPFQVKSPLPETPTSTIKKEALGEDFLKKIEAEVAAAEAPKKEVVKDVMAPATKQDEIRSAQAAPERKEGFSFVGYASKFIAFLGVVLLFFWGVVQLMKKGVLSKGKLGFLNNTQLVTVLSTTYVAPKRAILMVKAHNQVFLVSSSESGMSFIAEVKDVPGVVKETERVVAGSNFDDSVETAETTAPREEIKVKEDIYQSKIEEKAGVQKDIVRFSDELKKKVKNLKSLQ
jgi:flagellar biogenesis protein FliO